ncbi:hypothetical protein QMA88_01035 [Mycoplasma sp. M6642]|nr:hypothetical protein [Mycoplasma phocimorsus]MDJ1648116.1 hypothetical protein [Mycoplasma phocimorsus]
MIFHFRKEYNKIYILLNKNITPNKDSLFILGYPFTQFDYFLKFNNQDNKNTNYLENSSLKQSQWTNIIIVIILIITTLPKMAIDYSTN